VVLEWDNVLVPAGQVTVDLHGHEFCQPGDVLDLLLFQLHERVEAAEVETVFKGLRESLGLFLEHNLI